ncbi:hypothetical protein HMPREF9447_00830 [Bacteroides oleiciplenus YIT 12058]|uniref:Uncharacterized protein n=1 Tax=Bacteroides oleiciplenus YIT 12058 TaxID=742727 RepID=K9E464_9BACE|nr:hypothetical protein HMPREF9447_00830 [Bacteroides oleiciplenus YIT 12058]
MNINGYFYNFFVVYNQAVSLDFILLKKIFHQAFCHSKKDLYLCAH